MSSYQKCSLVTETPSSHSPGSLSAGGVIAIVIGSLVLFILFIAALIQHQRKKRKQHEAFAQAAVSNEANYVQYTTTTTAPVSAYPTSVYSQQPTYTQGVAYPTFTNYQAQPVGYVPPSEGHHHHHHQY